MWGGSPVQGESSVWRMDTPPSGSGPVMEEIWPCGRRSLRIARKQSLSSILLASERRCTYGCGCGYGRAPMAKRTALCLPSTNSDHTNSKKGKRVRPLSHTDFPELAGEIVAGGANEALGRPALASPAAQRPPLASLRGDISPRPGQSCSLGPAHERFNLNATGLTPKVIETIQNVRAASTYSVYDSKLNVVEEWCAHKLIVPFLCSVADVLCSLQELLDKGRAFLPLRFISR